MASVHFEVKPHGTMRNGQKLNTRTHAEYICREGAYAKMQNRQEDFVLSVSRNLPEWAEGNAITFWEKAEENRRKNGRAYREIIVGLQNELTLEQNIACIEELLAESGIADKHAFTYAIHDKVAAYAENGERNIHAHIMFCEKTIDKDRPLEADMYFSRYTEMDGKPVGGLKTNRYWNERRSVEELRNSWEKIVNNKFKEVGVPLEICLLSLEVQKNKSLEEGKEDEATLVNRPSSFKLPNASNSKTIERVREIITAMETGTFEDTSNEPTDHLLTEELKEREREQQMVVFAYHRLLRKYAKELYEEKKRQQAEEQRLEEERGSIVVTAGDVVERYELSLEKLVQEYDFKYDRYLALQDKVQTVATLKKATYQVVYGEDSIDTFKKAKGLTALRNKHKHTMRLHNQGVLVPSQDYVDAKYDMPDILEERKAMAKALLTIRKNRDGNYAPLFKRAYEMNARHKEEMDKLAKNLHVLQQNFSYQWKQVEMLLQEDPNKIIIAEGLPTSVTKGERLYGKIPLYKLPAKKINVKMPTGTEQKQFIIISQDYDPKAIKKQQVMAVCMDDPTFQGQAKVYKLDMDVGHTKDGKAFLRIVHVTKTAKEVPLYNNQQKAKSREVVLAKVKGKSRHSPSVPKSEKVEAPKTKAPTKPTGRNTAPPRQFTSPTETKSMPSRATNDISRDQVATGAKKLWHEREENQSEFERNEEKIKSGWSL